MLGYIGNKPVLAIESTAYTFTLSVDGSRFIRTQDAYMPAGTYLKEAALSSPEDLYYKDGVLYIADSGNHRIVVYHLSTGELRFVGAEKLKNPTGVVVAADGTMYVADYEASEVVAFSQSGEVKQRIGRPEAVYYGKSPYKPVKVDVDSFGNIFVISEGTHEGILQFSQQGVFSGFFGANKTKNLSLVEVFQKLVYTEEQKSKLFFRTPPNIVNLNVSKENLVYSVTQNDANNAIRKLNMAGVNIFQQGELLGSDIYEDVAVAEDGFFYGVTTDGTIAEFNEDGKMLYAFGGRAATTDRSGLTAVVSSIEVDENHNLYVLDKERGVLQLWYPTEYATLLHKAETAFRVGDYEASLDMWAYVLRMNPTAFISHEGYARNLFQMGKYEEAAEHYTTIHMAKEYSDCFWELRSQWMRSNMQTILLIMAGLVALAFIDSFLQKKYGYRNGLKESWRALKRRAPLVKQLVSDTVYFIRHPLDGVYYLKTGQRGSMAAATVLYLMAYLVYMLCRAFTSFVFGGGFGVWNDPLSVTLIVAIPMVLFVIGSYLISSINDGEGSLKQAYIVMGYALSAYIMFWPILTLLSNGLTITEIFTYKLLTAVILGYTALLFFIGIKEIHMYSIKKTISNILLTLAFMVIAVMAAIILYILWRGLVGFVLELFEEVRYRVFS